jgi:hypothetical protein
MILPLARAGQTAASRQQIVELSTGWTSGTQYAEDCFSTNPCAAPKVSGHPVSVPLKRPITFSEWLETAKVTPSQRKWITDHYSQVFSKCRPETRRFMLGLYIH